MIRFFRKLFKRGDFMTRADKAYYKYRAKTIFWSAFCLIIIAWVGTNLVLCALTTNVTSNFDMIYEARKSITLPTGYSLNSAISQIWWEDSVQTVVFDYYTSDGKYEKSNKNLIDGYEKSTLISNQDGSVEIYHSPDYKTVYILSDLQMYANPESNGMFESLSGLQTIEFNNFNTSQVTNMSNMFSILYFDLSESYAAVGQGDDEMRLINLDLSKWDVSNVTNMKGMFAGCVNFSTFNLSGWDTSKVEDMSFMFTMYSFPHGPQFSQSKSTTIDLSSFDTSSVTNMEQMFVGHENLTTIYVSDRFDVSKVNSSNYMFNRCTSLVGQNDTHFNEVYQDASRAYIDGKNGKTGYFTEKSYSGK